MSVIYMDGVNSMARILKRAGVVGFSGFNQSTLVLDKDDNGSVAEALRLYARFLRSYPQNMRSRIHSDICAIMFGGALAQR